LLGASLDVVGCLVLIPRLGAVGAAYAKGLSQVVAAAGSLGFMMWHFKVRLPIYRILRLGGVCVVMYFAVDAVVIHLAPLPALLLGIPLGVVVFVPLMRWVRCLDKVDRDRLRGLASMLPAPARQPYRRLIDVLAPLRATAA
jgi:O-antigen/teichoic acid export membrane protein